MPPKGRPLLLPLQKQRQKGQGQEQGSKGEINTEKAKAKVIVDKNKTRKLGWRVQSKFQIGLHLRDHYLLILLQTYLNGIGTIHIDSKRNTVNLSIDSVRELGVLIDHLTKYPLLTQKGADFILFKKVVKLINQKEHLTMEGLHQIINIKASLNLGLSNMLKEEFLDYIPVSRPVINTNFIPEAN